jgi:hypothetical protein
MHRRVRPELEVRRRELTWLTRAARLLESHDVAPDYAGARAWFAESSLVYDLHRRGAAYPSKGRVRSDLVDRVALALHVAAEQLGGGPTPAYAHGPPYFVVDAAVFLSSGPEDEEDRGELAALAAVRELRASPPDEVRVFIAAREAARLEPIWEDLGGFDIWFPHAPETPLTVHEVIADWVRVGETRRWPFLASEGGFGLSQEASDLMDARSGDVLGPYGFEGGWAVLRVNAVLQERSRAPRRGVLPPLVPFPARLDAVRELDRRIAQQGG